MIYVNFIENGPVVIEIQGVLVNNTFVRRTTFLAADTQPCVLII